jgi:hypothetical protein
VTATDGYVVGTTKVVDHGSGTARWDLVILGDGYQAGELGTYHQDVEDFLTEFRSTPPFNDLFCGINVHRVDIVSTDSGADEPTVPGNCGSASTSPRTFLDAKFCTPWNGTPLERLLTVDSGRAMEIATAQVPLRNQVLVIVNSSKYGGAGGQIATCSTEATSAKIAIHEIGHSAFGLADEYGGNGTGTPAGEPPKPNVTRNTDRTTNKWGDLIGATTPMPSACDGSCSSSSCVSPGSPPAPGAVGTYEGGIYSDCDTYRPLPSCYMRDYSPFCPVCSRVIRQTLDPFLPAEAINLITPSISFQRVPAGMGGVGVTTHRAIVFEVVTCRILHFTIVAGPTGGFGTPNGTSVEVSFDPILPAAQARLWLSYTSTNPGDSASGTVTVRCTETGEEWTINIDAETVTRPRAAVSLVLDRSYSMTEDAGDAVPKIQKLREACSAFLALMQPVDGVGIVRFNQAAQRIMEITDNGGGTATSTIMGSDLDPAGNTSIGDGVVKSRQMLTDAQAGASTPYDVLAMVVLTDGQWNVPPSLADVSGSITATTFAVGLGLPSNISVPALTALCQGHNGSLRITGAITPEQSMRLSKYFLQILAGVTNAQVAADPAGTLDWESVHRVPFWINEADYGMDLVVLSPHPQVIDFQLETPDGTLITPESGPSGANSDFQLSRYVSFYRCALPVVPWEPGGTHEGLWHAVLKLGRPRDARKHNIQSSNPTKKKVSYEFVAHTYSSLSFDASVTQSSFEVGAEARLRATLTEYEVPVGRSAASWAEIQRPDGAMDYVTLTMDDSLQFLAPYELTQSGVYSMRVRARGETTHGSAFERERTLTATASPGADNWDPNDPKPNDLCNLLHCLERGGVIGDRLRELCKKYGVDLGRLLSCLRQICLNDTQEDPRGVGGSTLSTGAIASGRLLEIITELRRELGEY